MEWYEWSSAASAPNYKKDVLYYSDKEDLYSVCKGSDLGHGWNFQPTHYAYIAKPK